MNDQIKEPILRIRRDEILQARKELREDDNLKKRAALAKERLKMGYWTQLAAERANFLKREGDTPENRLKKYKTCNGRDFCARISIALKAKRSAKAKKCIFACVIFSTRTRIRPIPSDS